MTTLLVTVRDDSKAKDLLSFLRDIDFLDVEVKIDEQDGAVRQRPAPELKDTRIVGNIVDPIVADSDWDALRETHS
jgi:hypothetical protein